MSKGGGGGGGMESEGVLGWNRKREGAQHAWQRPKRAWQQWPSEGLESELREKRTGWDREGLGEEGGGGGQSVAVLCLP
jgi:hypothetical protein